MKTGLKKFYEYTGMYLFFSVMGISGIVSAAKIMYKLFPDIVTG